jgi:serine/threonine protein kinase
MQVKAKLAEAKQCMQEADRWTRIADRNAQEAYQRVQDSEDELRETRAPPYIPDASFDRRAQDAEARVQVKVEWESRSDNLGQWAFASVHAGLLVVPVAVKKFRGAGRREGKVEQEEGYRMKFVKEAELCKKLGGQHVVEVYAVGKCGQEDCMMMEKMSLSLGDFLKNGGCRLAVITPLLKQLALGIAKAVKFVHGKNVMHRDLKGANILLNLCNADGQPFKVHGLPQQDFAGAKVKNIKLADFGVSKDVENTNGKTYVSLFFGCFRGISVCLRM